MIVADLLVRRVGSHFTVHLESPDVAVILVLVHEVVDNHELGIVFLVLEHEPRCTSVGIVTLQLRGDKVLVPDSHDLGHIQTLVRDLRVNCCAETVLLTTLYD